MTQPARILYIDDDPAIRRLVERDLLRHGYAVTLADSGPDGLTLAAATEFDLICLDHYMPVQDGLETLNQLRALSVPPPVIFVTGSEDGRLAVAALRAGAADYVIKEASGEFLHLLRATVESTLDREQLRRAKDNALRDLQIARDRAEHLAEQRAVLLREVNHRVANSLQLIASLTLLQEGSVSDPASRSLLAEVRGRIFAVAQVHRRLYTSDDVRLVALDEYLDGLLQEMARSIANAPGKATLSFVGQKLVVPTDMAVSLGVIAAELMTNAMKYAYPEGQGGPVRVVLAHAEGGGMLTVEDDGIGTCPDEAAGTGLGQTVIRAITEGLGGRVEHAAAPHGTRVVIHFPVNAPGGSLP